MHTVSTQGYERVLARCWETKQPLMVYGGFGIGKSQIPRQYFQKVADNNKRTFVEWDTTTNQEKVDIIAEPEKYFVFVDQRISQFDPTDIRGIPNMMNPEMLTTIPYSWVIYLTKPEAMGCLFFDEINLAPPTVAGAAYQVIQDRSISDRRVADGVFLMAAGNRAKDKGNVYTMSNPLRDRFAEMEVEPNIDDWTQYALSSGINKHLIAFVNWKSQYLYMPDDKGSDKSSTPRSIERASKMIGDFNITSEDAFEMISISVGQSFAAQFQAYAKYTKQLKWSNIYKNPKIVADFESDKLWAVCGGMADQFEKGVDDDRFSEIIEVVLCMEADFALVTLRMIKDTDCKKFAMQVSKCSKFQDITSKFGKFIFS